MAQLIRDWDTAKLARYVEDLIRQYAPSALVNISAEDITSNANLIIADQVQASQQALDYLRPPPQILISNTTQNTLPVTHNVTTSRFVKSGVLLVGTTFFATGVGATSVGVEWDSVSLGTMNFYANEASSHKTMTPTAFSLSDVAVGAHTIKFTNAGNAVMDANDRGLAVLFGG